MMQKIRVFLSVYYAYMVEYRAELLLWVLANSLPIIMMGVWIEAATATPLTLSPVQFARYFISVFLVRQFTVVWVAWDFEKEVVEGRLSPRLLQPLDPVWHHVAGHVAERFARLPFSVALIGLFFLLYPEAAWIPSWIDLFGFVLVLALAFALRFLIQYTFAICAFWTERATSIERVWLLFYTFLAGMVAPLDVFPESVRQVVQWTPFPSLVYFPASLLVGLPVAVGQSLGVMLGWIAIFWGINRWLWRRGLRQYSGMGA
ncbi:ABC transporter permease [Lyngbya confervoides]|uniref:ABC-2 family transporter protein n=1 Tax=Lyngbya confervoides BDU141951 TaxID=1574623 RepID=A0ABD4T3F2_9CYAN|nr:ABC-2 family transporter protein [Lyngbya confervoides]MCM1983176.1 ABC-2 family transporter protein [Lyngbya confervoides BDU141951]